MDYNSAIQKLFSLHQFGVKLGLDNISKLCNVIGNPQKKLKCFHVAGSNGKGSTASFLASILTEQGYKVGLYTSPHFVKFNERIRINGKEIDDNFIVKFVADLNSYIDSNSPTFFELTTAMAFQYFFENDVDFAVIETGLGGRLDATNIIDPLISIITTLSLEHTNILGETLEKIACEKAGIIKNNRPVILGIMPEEAENSIKEIAQERGSNILLFKDSMKDFGDFIIVENKPIRYHIFQTPLPGKHQLLNAGLAVKAVKEVLPSVDDLHISRGIRNVIPNTGIQGRYEIYNSRPRVIFDSAHNPAGIKCFLDEFNKEKNFYTKRTLIFGAMRDKNIKGMLLLLKNSFESIVLTTIGYERAATVAELEEIAGKLGIKTTAAEKPEEYIKEYINSKENEVLVVLGSMYILGEIKLRLMNKFS